MIVVSCINFHKKIIGLIRAIYFNNLWILLQNTKEIGTINGGVIAVFV